VWAEGAKSYDGEKAWSFFNQLILSDCNNTSFCRLWSATLHAVSIPVGISSTFFVARPGTLHVLAHDLLVVKKLLFVLHLFAKTKIELYLSFP
jgi:hypothetical protein